jgi:hypothetical protein
MARTAEDAMRQVGQAFSKVGLLDPRLSKGMPGKLDFSLTGLIAAWKRSDGGASRRRPLPWALLLTAAKLAKLPTASIKSQTMNALMWLGYFFLLRPGEYLRTASGRHPFTLENTFFRIQGVDYSGDSIPYHLLDASLISFAGFGFDMQKNGVPDEKIGLPAAIDDYICPVKALIRLVKNLRANPNIPPNTPLYSYYTEHGTLNYITDRHMTKYLRAISLSVTTEQLPTIGALRCTGATALLEGNVPVSLIKLLGRWRSDEVFRYLHTQSEPLMASLTSALADRVH